MPAACCRGTSGMTPVDKQRQDARRWVCLYPVSRMGALVSSCRGPLSRGFDRRTCHVAVLHGRVPCACRAVLAGTHLCSFLRLSPLSLVRR